MAVLPIRTFGDPVLKEICPDVEETGDDLERQVQDMLDSLPQPEGAGLSANQIGIMKRIFIYEDTGIIEVCVNPRIIWRSEDMEDGMEGCLSLPGVAVNVPRHLGVELEYMDMEGESHNLRVEGWMARVFQHEIDHLEGKLILDRTDRASRVEALQILEEHIQPQRRAEDKRLIL